VFGSLAGLGRKPSLDHADDRLTIASFERMVPAEHRKVDWLPCVANERRKSMDLPAGRTMVVILGHS
jgi:hypothetical protein